MCIASPILVTGSVNGSQIVYCVSGNIGCTRHMTKTSKERNTETKRMSNTDHTEGEPRYTH
jgi:hypothetical protein